MKTISAVILLAHGSPDSFKDVPDFLRHVTGGRALPSEAVDEIKHRYKLIGRSPLTELTLKQAGLLSRELGMPVYTGMRNWKPFIADVLASMVTAGTQHAVAICMAPQNSRTSVGLYRAALGATRVPFPIDFVESWHDHPLLIRAFAENLRAARENAGMSIKLPVIFTAHSVPQRTIAEGDPYEDQARETAALVARSAGLAAEDWTFAFQSQGLSGGPWLGPTGEETILALKAKGHRGVLVAPVGFLCDHVEVLYDIDIAFKEFAAKQGLRLLRTQSLNDSPLLTAALAGVAHSYLRG